MGAIVGGRRARDQGRRILGLAGRPWRRAACAIIGRGSQRARRLPAVVARPPPARRRRPAGGRRAAGARPAPRGGRASRRAVRRLPRPAGAGPRDASVAVRAGPLARALRLSDDERAHLFRVAGHAEPEAGRMRRHVTASRPARARPARRRAGDRGGRRLVRSSRRTRWRRARRRPLRGTAARAQHRVAPLHGAPSRVVRTAEEIARSRPRWSPTSTTRSAATPTTSRCAR